MGFRVYPAASTRMWLVPVLFGLYFLGLAAFWATLTPSRWLRHGRTWILVGSLIWLRHGRTWILVGSLIGVIAGLENSVNSFLEEIRAHVDASKRSKETD